MRPALLVIFGALLSATLYAADDAALEAAKAQFEKNSAKADQDLEVAKKKHADAVAAAKEKLISAYDAAIKRATQKGELEQANGLVAAKKQLLDGGDAEAVPAVGGDLKLGEGTPIAKIDPKKWYRGFLGVYLRREPRNLHPYVNLAVPNRDLWTEEIQAKLRGKIDFAEIAYEGQSLMVISKDGMYNINFDRLAQCYLDGKSISPGDIELKKGTYRVKFNADTHGQPVLNGAALIATFKSNGDPVTFVIRGADIRALLSQRVNGMPVAEMSGQALTEVKVD